MTDTSSSAVATGGSQGIGLAIARDLVAAGHRVAILGTRPGAAGDPIAASLGEGHVYLQCNVADEAQVEATFTEVERRLGPTAVLIDNAGVGSSADVAALEQSDWDGFFGVDLKGSWLTARFAVAQMRARGGGAIVNISSIHATLTRAGMFPYETAKAGVTWNVDGGLSIRLAS